MEEDGERGWGGGGCERDGGETGSSAAERALRVVGVVAACGPL